MAVGDKQSSIILNILCL